MKDLVLGFKKKPAFGELFRIDFEEMGKEQIEALFRGGNIFEQKNVLVCERLFEDEKNRDFVLNLLSVAKESENIFIFWEEKMGKEVLKKIMPFIEKTQEFKIDGVSQDKGPAKKDNRIFTLTDALSQRKRRQAFGIFHKLTSSGITAEDIFWIFFWQFKNLLLMHRYEGASQSLVQKNTGLHPFVIKKTIGASKNFRQEEIEERIEALIDLWQEVRLSNKDLLESLELFVLSI